MTIWGWLIVGFCVAVCIAVVVAIWGDVCRMDAEGRRKGG